MRFSPVETEARAGGPRVTCLWRDLDGVRACFRGRLFLRVQLSWCEEEINRGPELGVRGVDGPVDAHRLACGWSQRRRRCSRGYRRRGRSRNRRGRNWWLWWRSDRRNRIVGDSRSHRRRGPIFRKRLGLRLKDSHTASEPACGIRESLRPEEKDDHEQENPPVFSKITQHGRVSLPSTGSSCRLRVRPRVG